MVMMVEMMVERRKIRAAIVRVDEQERRKVGKLGKYVVTTYSICVLSSSHDTTWTKA